MYLLKAILSLFFLLAGASLVYAQQIRLKQTLYGEEAGLNDKIITDIVEDSNRLVWFISENNLYWFDGTQFNKIPHGNGIHEVPGNVYMQLYRSPEDEIWIIYRKGYSVYNPATHSFTHYKDIIPGRESEIYILNSEKGDELIFSSGSTSFSINRKTKRLIGFKQQYKNLLNPFPYSYYKDYTIFSDSNNVSFHFFNKIPDVALPISEKLQSHIFTWINDSIILFADNRSISAYSINSRRVTKTITYPGGKYLQAYRKPLNIIARNKTDVIVSLDEELWIFNISTMQFSEKIVSTAGNNFIENGYLKKLYFDSRGNLWASSNLYGVMKISFQSLPIRLLAKEKAGLENNFIKCFSVNKELGKIIAGTYGKGLQVYDSSGNLLKQFPLPDAQNSSGAIITSIGRLSNEQYLILSYLNSNQYILNLRNLTLQTIQINELKNVGYYQEFIELQPGELLYPNSLLYRYTKLTWQNNSIVVTDATQAEIKRIETTGTIKAHNHNLTDITGNPYFNNCLTKLSLGQAGRLFLQKKGSNWLFGTIKGIFEFDSQTNIVNTYNKESGLADEYIYAIVIDNYGDIWCSHNKGISRISKDGSILNLGKEDGLQADEFNFGAAAKENDGEIYFGGTKGLNSFYPAGINRQLETPKLLVSHISTSNNSIPADTAFWNIHDITLPFEKNNIHILLSAIGNNSGNYYTYQYRVKGMFSEWKNLGQNREINLSLPPGEYTLEMSCGNAFMKDAIAQKSINIKVIPPVYQRWWFILLAAMALLALSIYIVFVINKQRYNKKLTVLKMQQQVEHERRRISRDLHDNMGAYTTALLSDVEKLRLTSSHTPELDKMKNNAQQILNSLRETIWVLNNKEVSIADISDSFKNHCVKMLQSFDNIHFESIENISGHRMLLATEAIHFDKILKEAFQNILKHSAATEIIFRVNAQDDSFSFSLQDNGKGFNEKLANKGNGLDNMRWRAREAGAGILIETPPSGKGTMVTVSK